MNNAEFSFFRCLYCNTECVTEADCPVLFLLCAGLLVWIGILVWLYRVQLVNFLWSLVFRVRPHARDVQELTRLIAHCRIRIRARKQKKHKESELLPLFGEDKELDEKLEKTVDMFFEKEWRGSSQCSEVLPEILNWLKDDDVSKCHRQKYLRVSWRIAEKTGEKDEADLIASTYRSIYKKDIESIERNDIRKARSEFQERFRKELNDFWDSRAKPPLFSFSLKESAVYLPIVSVLIIIGAYFHLLVFYGHFNIEVSQFFSLDDYVASSIEEIWYSLSFVGIYLVFWAAVLRGYRSLEISPPTSQPRKLLDLVRRKSQNLTRKIQLEYVRRERKFRRRVLIIAYIGCVAVISYMIPESKKIPLDGFGGFFILLIGVLLIRVLVLWFVRTVFWNRKHFKNVFAEIALLSLIMFFSSMYLAACGKIEKIEKSPTKVYERETGIEDYAYKGSLIGANNRYIFLRNPDQNTTTIIPQSEAGRIVISTVDHEPEKKCSSNGLVQNIESCFRCGSLGERATCFKNRLNWLFRN